MGCGSIHMCIWSSYLRPVQPLLDSCLFFASLPSLVLQPQQWWVHNFPVVSCHLFCLFSCVWFWGVAGLSRALPFFSNWILLSWLTKFCFTWCVWMLISSLLQNRWPLHGRLWHSSHTSFSQSLCLNNTTPVLSCLWWDLCSRWWLTSLIQSIVVTTKPHHYNWRLQRGPCTQQKIRAQGVTKSSMKRVNSRGN